MAATTGQSRQSGGRWQILLRPRWLAWHAFAVVAFFGMLCLGDWQLHRALSGNELSWAYTFEWPLFALFGVYFWYKTVRDELRQHDGAAEETDSAAADAASAPVDVARAMPADGEAYLARLKAEAQRRGRRRRGWR